MHRNPQSLEESYRYCADLTRAEARNFYYTFWLLTPDRRRAIYAVYAFSRRLDDVVDTPPAGPVHSSKEIQDRHRELEKLRSFLGPQPPVDPLVPALRETVDRFRIPGEYFDELVEGMRMDLERRRYDTFEDLRLYCYRAASTVGLVCIEIFGHDGAGGGEAVRDPAVDMGIAMQLTNILRDIPEDLARERIYLPANELDRFGVSESSLRSGEVNDSFRALMAFQVARAREYFRRSEALFPHLSPTSRFCPMLLKRFYSELLNKMESSGYDVFHHRPALSPRRKVRLAVSFWVRSLVHRFLPILQK